MVDSPHTARWIRQIAGLGWDLHIFPVYEAPANLLLEGVTVHRPWITIRPRRMLRKLLSDPLNARPGRIEMELHANRLPVRAVYPVPVPSLLHGRLSSYKTEPLGESPVRSPLPYGPRVLAKLIKKLKPDLIHSMEFQHAGYLTLAAKEFLGAGNFPKWLATNWGSDIFFYRQFPDHRRQISRLLKEIDFYSCECKRDIGLAHELGLKAPAMPVLPNTGGFDLEEAKRLRSGLTPSGRTMLMVKGYESFAGRALTALEAVARCTDVLRNWRVVVFSASPKVRERIEELRLFHGLNITALEQTSHDKVLRFFAHARAYLGVSASDAISTSMIEAMAMGAFPIQTDTSCCSEWFEDGKSGFSVPHTDVGVIADRLRQAATRDELVDSAAEVNWKTVADRLDQNKLKPQVRDFYAAILQQASPDATILPGR